MWISYPVAPSIGPATSRLVGATPIIYSIFICLKWAGLLYITYMVKKHEEKQKYKAKCVPNK